MAACVCWKRRRFPGGWKVFSVTWKIPCGDVNTIHDNKVCVLRSGCHLKLSILLFFFHSVNLMKMGVRGKLPWTAIYVVWKKLLLSVIETPYFTKEFVFCYYLMCKKRKLPSLMAPKVKQVVETFWFLKVKSNWRQSFHIQFSWAKLLSLALVPHPKKPRFFLLVGRWLEYHIELIFDCQDWNYFSAKDR